MERQNYLPDPSNDGFSSSMGREPAGLFRWLGLWRRSLHLLHRIITRSFSEIRGLDMERSDLLRLIRSQPHVYSLFCKSALFYSRHVVGASDKKALNNHKELFLTGMRMKHGTAMN